MSALRALRQLTSLSTRTLTPRVGAVSSRTTLLFRQVPLVTGVRTFSATPCTFNKDTANGLSRRLQEELKYEEMSKFPEPEALEEFKKLGIWQIQDTPGNEEIVMTRKFGKETIRLMFSILDIQDTGEDEYLPEEGGQGEANEQEENKEETEEDEDEEVPMHMRPIRVSFTITKPSVSGAINIDTMCQNGTFIVDNIAYYHDAKLATDLTAEADWIRRGLYLGPHFDTLDMALQNDVDAYLRERGIDDTLAVFIPAYAEYKDQGEYMRWLKNIKSFVDA